jgi:hypothetical protein
VAACGDDENRGDDGVDPDAGPDASQARVVARFELEGHDWGVRPFPSDLYLGEDDKLDLDALPAGPAADPAALTMLREGLATMTGAGLRTNVYFPVEREAGAQLDLATVADAAVLVDLDDVSAPIAGSTIYRDDLDAIVFVPELGTVLKPDHAYAAYLLDSVETTGGDPLARDDAFAAWFDTSALAAALPATTRDRVVVATELTTAAYPMQTKRMRDSVAATPATPVITDVLTGAEIDALVGSQVADAVPGQCPGAPRAQPHDHVAAIVQGTIALTSFLSDIINLDGMPEYDVTGEPTVKGSFGVKFTLSLPTDAAGDYANLPVVLYVHDLDRSRLDLVTQMNTAARQGFAMLAIDLPHHGDRATAAADTLNETLGTAAADGFGDRNAPAAGHELLHFGTSGGIPAYHPRAIGENLRAAAIELVELAAFVRDGDDTTIEAAIASIAELPDTLTFRDDVGIVAESVGANVATVALAVEPGLGVAYLQAPAGGVLEPTLLHSPNYAPTLGASVIAAYDVADRSDPANVDLDYRVDPLIMLLGNVIERGDAIAYAPLVASGEFRGGVAPDLVVAADWGDVWVPNDGQEALARALDLPVASLALAEPPAQSVRYVELEPAAWPVTANAAGGASACLVVFHPAGHAALRMLRDTRNYEPLFPPYVAVSPPEVIADTQTAEIHELWSETLADHFDGGAVTIEDPYADADAETGTSCP